ncbi:hypothetical protein RB195_013435 [Necator americanus]|uniref:Collagen triple helix repeat protein n=1 Tax=Necator americanus TaxID=51031 RepID=A0ABR1DVJ2_NECAM
MVSGTSINVRAMKFWITVRNHASLVMVTMTSFCTIGGCLLLMFLVRDELKNVESCISQVNRDIDEQSTKSWKILRELNVDSSIIRERREALRKLHRLSTASAIGISRKRVVVSPIEREASINTRDGYVEESKGGLDQQPGTDSVGPINGYASATYSYSPPSSFPNANPTSSQSNPYSSTGYGGSTEYGAQVEAIKKAPECKCSLTNNCPPGPEGPKGTPGMNGIDGDAGFEGVNGKSGEVNHSSSHVFVLFPRDSEKSKSALIDTN